MGDTPSKPTSRESPTAEPNLSPSSNPNLPSSNVSPTQQSAAAHPPNSDLSAGPSSTSQSSSSSSGIEHKSSDDCSICLHPMDPPSVPAENDLQSYSLDCTHAFHRVCIGRWLALHSSKCPLCRKFVGNETMTEFRKDWQPPIAGPIDNNNNNDADWEMGLGLGLELLRQSFEEHIQQVEEGLREAFARIEEISRQQVQAIGAESGGRRREQLTALDRQGNTEISAQTPIEWLHCDVHPEEPVERVWQCAGRQFHHLCSECATRVNDQEGGGHTVATTSSTVAATTACPFCRQM